MTSITVEFRSVGPGACAWCRKEKDEVFSVAFSDKSFVGPMCKGDLLRAIGMKVGPHEPDRKLAVPTANNAVPAVPAVPAAK